MRRNLVRTTIFGGMVVAALLAVAGLAPTAENPVQREPTPVSLPVRVVSRPPLVDGRGIDDAWRAVAWAEVADPGLAGEGKLAVKACTTGERLYLLVRFPAREARRRHRPWHWDPVAQLYRSGQETEMALSVLLFGEAMVDVWVWRAERTNAAGYADDGRFDAAAGFVPDAGDPCWESRPPGDFAGPTLQRFYPRQPTGSQADVRARGTWEQGWWTVELSRRLTARNADDVTISPTAMAMIQLFTGLPTAAPEPRHPILLFTPEMPVPNGEAAP